MDDFLEVKSLFNRCESAEDRYKKIISLGKQLPPLQNAHRVPENIIPGCQSIVYLHTELRQGKLFFTAASDALISSGLAALLILAYNEKTPEFLLKNKPSFLDELHISASLTPGRSNGLASMFLRMQQDAVKFLASV